MALTVKDDIDLPLVRLIDSRDDNPLELTMGATGTGRIALYLEDRDAGTSTEPLVLDAAELRAALALLDLPHVYVEP
jgi:hypothetical protein